MYELGQKFIFEAAHTLRRDFDTESSCRVHGHTYSAEITVAGEPDRLTGMIVDLCQLRAAIGEVREELDHRLLDHVDGLGAATLENLCAYIARRLAAKAMSVCSVRVWREGSGDSCRLQLER